MIVNKLTEPSHSVSKDPLISLLKSCKQLQKKLNNESVSIFSLTNLKQIFFVHEVFSEAEIRESHFSRSEVKNDVAQFQVSVDNVPFVKILDNSEDKHVQLNLY